MKSFLKLLNFELNRFSKLYGALILFIIIIQITGVVVLTRKYLYEANKAVIEGGMTQQAFVEHYGAMSLLEVTWTLWIMGPIAVAVAGLLLYLFLIWYRDWLGKNTFIYRLLMLPTSRMNLFFSKVTTIMLTVLGLVAVQIILLNIENTIIRMMVPKVLREDLKLLEITSIHPYLGIIIPSGFTQFLIAYGIGFLFVVVVFTAILFERSFRIKGLLLGALYVALAALALFSPMLIQVLLNKKFLYPEEMLIVGVVIWGILLVSSLYISRYLLKKKITV